MSTKNDYSTLLPAAKIIIETFENPMQLREFCIESFWWLHVFQGDLQKEIYEDCFLMVHFLGSELAESWQQNEASTAPKAIVKELQKISNDMDQYVSYSHFCDNLLKAFSNSEPFQTHYDDVAKSYLSKVSMFFDIRSSIQDECLKNDKQAKAA